MEDLISPKYQMRLVGLVQNAIWNEFDSHAQVKYYINKWYENNFEPGSFNDNFWENFTIYDKEKPIIDLLSTLHSMPGSILLKIAIDLGVDTPDFIPSIPTFKNELKSDYKTAYSTFTKSYKLIETDPSLAIGLANSALESIIKEILNDDRINSKMKGGETLYKLTTTILKEFNLTSEEHPIEIRTIGSSLAAISQAIEKIRSEKTDFHGKTTDDYLINDPIYTYFVINSVSTVGIFLISYYKTKFPKPKEVLEIDFELPF